MNAAAEFNGPGEHRGKNKGRSLEGNGLQDDRGKRL